MNPPLVLKLANTPLLLNNVWGQTVSARLQMALAKQAVESELSKRAEAADTNNHQTAYGHFLYQGKKVYRPYRVNQGVAVIPIHDVLYHKWNSISYWGTGYEGILRWTNTALIDPEVNGLLFDFDSPGGMVAGCFDCVATLVSLKGKKPFWGVASDLAASAAFALYSAMDRRLITQTGRVGSVGVVRAHWSYENYLKEEGIKVTLIHAGDHKVDGNPYQDLPEKVLADFQADAERTRNQFAQIVSSNIGLKTQSIVNTEAKTYTGQAAIDLGFSEALINGNDAVSLFAGHLKPTSSLTIPINNTKTAGVRMSDTTEATPVAQTPPAPAPQTSTASTTSTAQKNEPTKTEATTERQRIQAILQHDNAEGREAMAQHLAFNTNQSVDEATALLAVSPKAQAESSAPKPESASTGLDAVMAQVGNPNITADAQPSQQSNQDKVARMMANHSKATGVKANA